MAAEWVSVLPIALHHGSLDVSQRRKGGSGDGQKASSAQSSARRPRYLGIDWGDVDLVINVGAPKGASRLDATHWSLEPPA